MKTTIKYPDTNEEVHPQTLKHCGLGVDDVIRKNIPLRALILGRFPKDEINAAGVSIPQLLKSKVSVHDLAVSGYSPRELIDAGVSFRAVCSAGYDAKTLEDSRITVREMHEHKVPLLTLIRAGYSLQGLLEGGFVINSIVRTRKFPLQELLDVGAPRTLLAYHDYLV